ncbi:P-loop containing nucleoside triphosphate hydrolase protein [Lipomyces tetrasporus]|uniref:P-loop containing nucleoside triphosphate hydrolase protein n=1 Tax=Lipomyces tetrasporus TaxID=54092 RepID=A0AAD7QW07_9ASCO|nr:P-loop containing nucleoside triphosphate hydrolase protein [Lipomyces tetrasporus]KAJ8101901.1 P-loop containing nucleoside triphosphate hydrolase protein [Lipomyces tetrasporus]
MGRRIRNLNTGATSGPLLSTAAIDSRVYALISSYLASNAETNQPALSVRQVSPSALLQVVQSSDAALRRLKKTVVEKSIETVLRQISHEEREAANVDANEHIELDSDFDGVDESYLMEVKDTNSMNKGIVGLWDTGSNKSQTTVEIPDDSATGNDPVPATDTSSMSVAPSAPPTSSTTPRLMASQQRAQASKKRDRGQAGDGSTNKRPKGGSTGDKEDRSPPTNIRLSDIGGMDHIVAEMLELVGMPIMHPEIYLHTGIHPPRGVLLHGPPGCGKTMLANAIAGELGVPFISLSAPSIVSGMSGESEKRVREIFEEARSIAPCLIFLDEIDAITPKRESAQREMERRIVAQLLTCMDDLSLEKTDGRVVMIIGATNRPDSLDPALRRAGRFDREIQMNVPDEISRESILRVLSRKLRLSGDFDFKALARMTSGYVGADLNALTTAAGIAAIKRIFRQLKPLNPQLSLEFESGSTDGIKPKDELIADESTKQASGDEDYMDVDVIDIVDDDDGIPAPQKMQHNLDKKENSIIQQFMKDFPDTLTPEQLQPLSITVDDFLTALPSVQPSSKREGFATIPDVTWADVGALERVRIELQMAIVQPIRRPELYAQVGITAPAGVLLWGPPGCGKTLLAKAVANESRANFISVRGPELLNKFVGESERAVRQVFLRARASVPCVIFFDELDALVPKRDDSLSESSARVVNTLLTELDGLSDRNGIYVIAATNRPDIIDPAMLRPGRLDKPLFVELPTAEERAAILRTVVGSNTPLDETVNLNDISADSRCRNFSGADLAALVREAAVGALRTAVFALKDDHGDIGESTAAVAATPKVVVKAENFENAFKNVKPSVSDKDRAKYERLGREYGWSKE